MLYPDRSTTRPRVSSPYGPRDPRIGISSIHAGADLIGFETIHAIAAGKVTFAGWMNDAAGNTIVIDHGNGVSSRYMHNESHRVRRGQRVDEGEPIGEVGQSGNATGDCLHLEVRLHSKHTDPLAYIAARLPRPSSSTPATNPTTPEEDTMILFIKGKAGARRGGLYLIRGDQAEFLGSTSGKGFPTLTDEREIVELQKHVKGIG